MFRCDLYTDRDDDRPAATGYAHEYVAPKGINSTSAAEVCETSAIGRALANLGYSTTKQRPSREEMAAVLAAEKELVRRRGLIASTIAELDEVGREALRAEWVEAKLPPPDQLPAHLLDRAESLLASGLDGG